MKKVWYRTSDRWWYLTLSVGGGRQQIKLIKGPSDKETKEKAERQAVLELAARQHAQDGDEKAPSWAIAGHVIGAFLKYSAEEHTKETATWYCNLLTPFRAMFGKVRLSQLRKRHVRAWLVAKSYNPTSANRAVGASSGRSTGLSKRSTFPGTRWRTFANPSLSFETAVDTLWYTRRYLDQVRSLRFLQQHNHVESPRLVQ